jgi:micrococcal nuclease
MISLEDAMNVNKFSLDCLEFDSIITKVYDGDSVHAVFEFKGEYNKWVCRLHGIDTPEIRSKNQEEKENAIDIRDKLREKILHKQVLLKCHDFDKYGRLLVNIYLDGDDINNWLKECGYAYEYFGGTTKTFCL